MPTFRQVASDIINDVRAISLDDRLSYRYIINKLKDKASYFFHQDSESRKLFKISDLWFTIKCVPLEDVPEAECPSWLTGCKTIKRSKFRIPDTYTTKYGDAFKVLAVNNSKEFTQIKSNQFADYANNPYAKNYFWIEDGYLWFPNSSLQFVKIIGIFKNTIEVDKLNDDATDCATPLDSLFNMPDYIVTIAKQEILKELFPAKSIQVDENPNQNNLIK